MKTQDFSEQEHRILPKKKKIVILVSFVVALFLYSMYIEKTIKQIFVMRTNSSGVTTVYR